VVGYPSFHQYLHEFETKLCAHIHGLAFAALQTAKIKFNHACSLFSL
jgi:hypothetical protein